MSTPVLFPTYIPRHRKPDLAFGVMVDKALFDDALRGHGRHRAEAPLAVAPRRAPGRHVATERGAR